MSITYDFRVIGHTRLPGMSLIVAQNESAFSYLTDECDLNVLPDGSAPVFNDCVGDFISDAENAHLCCDYV